MASHKNTLHSDSTQDFHKRLQGSKATEPYKPVFYKLLRITYYRGYISPISVVGVRLRLEVVEPIQHPFCKCYLCLILQCTAYCSHFFGRKWQELCLLVNAESLLLFSFLKN